MDAAPRDDVAFVDLVPLPVSKSGRCEDIYDFVVRTLGTKDFPEPEIIEGGPVRYMYALRTGDWATVRSALIAYYAENGAMPPVCCSTETRDAQPFGRDFHVEVDDKKDVWVVPGRVHPTRFC